MTDAAYQKALRDAEKQLARSQEEYSQARSAWETLSIRQCGMKVYLIHWLHLQQARGACRKKQDKLQMLRSFKRISPENLNNQ
jgi:hypothetical protein